MLPSIHNQTDCRRVKTQSDYSNRYDESVENCRTTEIGKLKTVLRLNHSVIMDKLSKKLPSL